MIFHLGKSYVWLSAPLVVVFAVSFLVSRMMLGDVSWGILTMPTFVLFVLVSEIRSEVALDSWWRATYPKGTFLHKVILAVHATGVVLLSVMSYFFINHGFLD